VNARNKEADPRGAHFRMYHSVMDSPAWNCLSATDQRAYFVLARQKMSFNNGDLSLPISFARHYGITNERTLAKNLRALAAVGLIAITRTGAHRLDGTHTPNLYRLTDWPVNPMPGKHVEACKATNEWRNVQSKAHGLALIREAEKRAVAARQEAKTLRNLEKAQRSVAVKK
jgi:hypothetical protein